MIGAAVAVDDLLAREKLGIARPLALFIVAGAFVYTLLFSMAMVKRMTPVDSRIECAEWLKTNVPADATVGLACYFPWNFTPPIENIFKPENVAVTGDNYDNLLASKCQFFIITEYEVRDLAYGRTDKYTARKFMNELFSQRDYRIIKEFKRDFMIFGLKFPTHYPNMDWNPVNPEIYVFQKK
jgi:hypothetical protein